MTSIPPPKPGDAPAHTPTYPPASARIAWILFDCAAQPFFTLITTFIFGPFFAAAVAANPTEGQALWGYATGAAGLVIALGSPVLGAIADETGARKPWIAFFGALLVLGSALLWWTQPGTPAAVPIALVGFAIGTVGAEFATVFNNAMMPHLAPPERLGRLSGTGWAVGYVGGLVALVLTLLLLVASPETGRTLAGVAPVLGLDPATFAGERATGPLTALWFMLFVLPMFLLTPDSPSKATTIRSALGDGLRSLAETLRGLRRQPALARFLLANMIYSDGLVAIFAFGGIYAAGAFGWDTMRIGIFGIILITTGALGAFAGGRLDETLGPRRVIMICLAALALAAFLITGTTRDTVLFVIPVAPPEPGGGLFASTAERVYVALGIVIGVVAGPMQAASRTLLVRLAEPGRIGQSFGLLALSGKATSFVAPLLVATVTHAMDSQRAGISVILLFFAAGLALLARVKA